MTQQKRATDPIASREAHPLTRALAGLNTTWLQSNWWLLLLGLCVVLIIADLVASRSDYVTMAETTGFYIGVGFFSAALLVLAGWVLRRLIGRGRDYYGDDDE
jgi:hypothetical protein